MKTTTLSIPSKIKDHVPKPTKAQIRPPSKRKKLKWSPTERSALEKASKKGSTP